MGRGKSTEGYSRIQPLQIIVSYPEKFNPTFVSDLEEALPAWVKLDKRELITRAVLPPLPSIEVVITFTTVTLAAGGLAALGGAFALAGKDKIKNLIYQRKRNKRVQKYLESAYFTIRIDKENLLIFGDASIEDFKTTTDALLSLSKVVSSAQRKRRAALKGKPQRPDFRKVRYYDEDEGPEGSGTYAHYDYKSETKHWSLKKLEVYEPVSFDHSCINDDGSLKQP